MSRLSREQWLNHGLSHLAQSGFTTLKADTLSASLGVSRGSFYWHFKNLADFHHAILAHWQAQAVTQVIEQLQQTDMTPEQCLEQLLQLSLDDGNAALHRAIRAWATSNRQVQSMLADVDQQCLLFLQQILESLSFESEQAFIRARVVYYAYLGQYNIEESLSVAQKNAFISHLLELSMHPPS